MRGTFAACLVCFTRLGREHRRWFPLCSRGCRVEWNRLVDDKSPVYDE